MKKLIASLILVGFIIAAPSLDARSSGSHSSSHSSGSSYHSSGSSSGGSSSYHSSGWGSSSSTTSSHQSAADKNTASSSNESGDDSGSRSSWFDSEPLPQESSAPSTPPTPTTAPTPMPAASPTYAYNGQTYSPSSHYVMLSNGTPATVYYNYAYGGNGFWNNYGQFILLNSLMQQQQQPEVTILPSTPMTYESPHPSQRTDDANFAIGFFLIVAGIIAVMFIISAFASRRRTAEYADLDTREFAEPVAYKVQAVNTIPIVVSKPATVTDDFKSWVDTKPGAMITLRDAQALEDSQKAGRGMSGMDYKVEKVTYMENAQGTNHWLFLELSGEQDLLMMIKESGQRTDKRVYMAVEDFKSGTRQDMLDNDQKWLFQDPGSEAFDVDKLHYTTAIERESDDGDAKLNYIIKSQREQHGPIKEKPDGITDLVATLVEYSTTDQTDNPEALVIEIGKAKTAPTSHMPTTNIKFYLGAPIRDSEVRRLA